MPAFWWHYNKPETKKQGRNVCTVHYGGRCILVYDVINTGVPTRTRHRKTQPRIVVAGRGEVIIRNGQALLMPEKPKGTKKKSPKKRKS